MATKKIKRFQEGGMSDKDRGLEASKDEKVGFFERLRMGNIDDEGSEAYRRFGAGRGKASRTPVEDRVATPVNRPMAAAPEMDEMEAANAREPIPVPAGPRVEKSRVNTQTAKPSAPTKSAPAKSSSGKTSAYPMTGAQPTTKTYERKGGPTADDLANYRPPARNQSLASQIPGTGNPSSPVKGEQVEPMSDTERNVKNALMATGAGAGVAGAFYKGKKMLDARKAAQEGAKKRANLKRDVEEGIERNLADEFQNLASSAKSKKAASSKKTPDYRSLSGRAREDAKADQAYDKLKKLSSGDSGKTSSRENKTLNPMAWMSGPKSMADDFRRGGKVKKMASGGSVSNPSKRADGAAIKGKTRCKMR
jgi:hypothetical protein